MEAPYDVDAVFLPYRKKKKCIVFHYFYFINILIENCNQSSLCSKVLKQGKAYIVAILVDWLFGIYFTSLLLPFRIIKGRSKPDMLSKYIYIIFIYTYIYIYCYISCIFVGKIHFSLYRLVLLEGKVDTVPTIKKKKSNQQASNVDNKK